MDSADIVKQGILQSVMSYYLLKEKVDDGIIHYAGKCYDFNEMVNAVESVLDFDLTHGKWCNLFEKKLAEFLDVKYCLLVNSGSSANLLAFMALTSPSNNIYQIKRGDEIITTACCFPTTLAPIIQYGAVPVFVDVDENGNIDCNELEKAYTIKTKAIMTAHTLGNPFNIEAVNNFCKEHCDIYLIEDNCDSLGSKYNNKYTGTFGDIGTSSFYPAHHICMGEGGAVYTDNLLLYKIMLSMRDWGRACTCNTGEDNKCGKRFSQKLGKLPNNYDHKYIYQEQGFNLKATEMQAAIGVAQLDKLENFIKKRQENFIYLYNKLKGLQDYLILPQTTEYSNPSPFSFLILTKEGVDKNKLVEYLENNKIQTRPLFAGNILLHPCFDSLEIDKDYRVIGDLKNTNYIMNNGFMVGIYPGLNNKDLDKISNVIWNYFIINGNSQHKENNYEYGF
jgi:CDP-6-deoxy-D-xylo-4-hexulose-3-dehydrase